MKIIYLILTAVGCSVVSYTFFTIVFKHVLKRQNCLHKHKSIFVENVVATCEKTTTTCLECGKKTTKIEC